MYAYEDMERRKMELRLQREFDVREQREQQRMDILARKMEAAAAKRADEACHVPSPRCARRCNMRTLARSETSRCKPWTIAIGATGEADGSRMQLQTGL